MAKMSKCALCGFVIVVMLVSVSVRAENNEIKLGQTMPYSGPLAVWGIFGKAASAYFAKINDEGGINGKKVTFLSYDDQYSPPKALEQVRKLVEQDGVLANYASGGTAVNTAIQRYLNDRKIPQLFATSGGDRFDDPENYPWTIGWQPNFVVEARIYTKYALRKKPNAKIGVLYQNDDYGKAFLKGIKEIIKETGKGKIVATVSYEPTDPTIETQIIKLKSSGADVFFNVTSAKHTVQAIKMSAEKGWRPMQFIYTGTGSVTRVFKPAGLDNSTGILTGAFIRDPSDPAQQQTKEYKEYAAWVKKYLPEGRPDDLFVAWPYCQAQTMEHVLHNAGNDLSRENLLKQATNIKGLKLPMLLPGVEIETSPTDYRPIESMQMQRFDGTKWQLIGGIVKGR